MDTVLMELNDLGGDWNAQMGSCTVDDDETMYAVRITVETDNGEIVRGAINEDLFHAVDKAVAAVTMAVEGEDYEQEDLESATEVLRATLDELGFDRAVALLERLNNC